MQLIRYLMKEILNFQKKHSLKGKLDAILKNTVFDNLGSSNNLSYYIGSGLNYHVADIYFETMLDFCSQNNQSFSLDKLEIFEFLLHHHKIEHFRHHILNKIYG